MAILEAFGIDKHFGGLTANLNINFKIEEGRITSIIGPNGAGKTTLFNILTGLYKPDAGKVLFEGQDISGWPIHKIVKLGIARSFQVLNIFNEISPAENIRLAVQARKKNSFHFWRSAQGFEDTNQETSTILDEIGLSSIGENILSADRGGDRA
jgi:branched-chain amino acid transport system ATP-binding protein